MYEAPPTELRGTIRVGRIDSVDKDSHRAKVKFDEQDGFTSWDLQVLIPVGGDYALPKQNTPVLCLIVDGRLGAGYVLGSLYTDNDSPPLSDAGKRSVVSDDLRLGTSDASDKVALAPKCKDNFDKIKEHFDVVWQVVTGPAINEPGNGSPSAFQTALAGAINGKPYPTPGDPKAEKVSAK